MKISNLLFSESVNPINDFKSVITHDLENAIFFAGFNTLHLSLMGIISCHTEYLSE